MHIAFILLSSLPSFANIAFMISHCALRDLWQVFLQVDEQTFHSICFGGRNIFSILTASDWQGYSNQSVRNYSRFEDLKIEFVKGNSVQSEEISLPVLRLMVHPELRMSSFTDLFLELFLILS